MSFSTILNVSVFLFLFSNRIPEAAFMARTYLPSQVSRIVSLWRNDLKKVSHPLKCAYMYCCVCYPYFAPFQEVPVPTDSDYSVVLDFFLTIYISINFSPETSALKSLH